MKLYTLPGACSLASAIALREAGIPFESVKVDKRTKQADGVDFRQINPKGSVPALQLDNGEVLTENVAVLTYIADLKPGSGLAPAAGSPERYRLAEWLGYINSEVHKAFSPLFSPEASEEVKQYARKALNKQLDHLQSVLSGRQYLMGDRFTVADAYLFIVLGWGQHVGVDIGRWPALQAYRERIAARPSVQQTLEADRARPKPAH
ncbi:MAG: glutathione transferase GstA [Sinobacteraceae bacterium]|nr:glutathione transferase GstA [Nevskiaceae bacterium]